MQIKTKTLGYKKVKLDRDTCKELCASVGYDYHDGDEERVFEYTITDETPDRAGDIVRYKGADWSDYFPANPVVMYGHNYDQFPIGKCLHIRKDDETKSVKAWALIFGNEVDETGFSNAVYKMVSNGAMPGCSIGFQPKEKGTNYPQTEAQRVDMGLGKWGAEIVDWKLMEFSLCSIPCNPSALSKYLDEKEVDMVTKAAKEEKEDNNIIERVYDRIMLRIDELEKSIKELKQINDSIVESKALDKLQKDFNDMCSKILG